MQVVDAPSLSGLGRFTLESGDHVSRRVFHARYCAHPEIKKAELVEGVVIVASPVRSDLHAEPHGKIVGWLISYQARVKDVRVSDNATVILDSDNELQPDACISCEGPGGPRLSEDHYIEGAPQLVVEIAASSVSYDLHEKYRVYRRNGVREYLVWRVEDRAIDWFRLNEGEYERVAPDATGVIESSTFPGLRLHVEKLLANDLAGVLAELRPPVT